MSDWSKQLQSIWFRQKWSISDWSKLIKSMSDWSKQKWYSLSDWFRQQSSSGGRSVVVFSGQTVGWPTRGWSKHPYTPNSATLIDHFLSNKVEDETKTGILTVKISDHFPIFYAVKCKKHVDQIKYLQVRDFSKRNIDSFKEDLSQIRWNNVYECVDVQITFFRWCLHQYHTSYIKHHIKHQFIFWFSDMR